MAFYDVVISHWLPIITICPINKLPDVLYIYISFDGSEFNELYDVRKRMRKAVSWRKCYMEDVVDILKAEFPNAKAIRVSLVTGRHEVYFER